MNKIFKVKEPQEIFKLIKDHPISIRAVTQLGLNLEKILNHCILEISSSHSRNPEWVTRWFPADIDINPSHIYDVEILLKLAWYFSSAETKNHLREIIAEELTKFELGMIPEKIRLKNQKSATSARSRIPALDTWIEEELISNPKIDVKQLWASIPESSSVRGEGIYRDADKVYSSCGSGKSLGINAFYKKVAKIKKIVNSDAIYNEA